MASEGDQERVGTRQVGEWSRRRGSRDTVSRDEIPGTLRKSDREHSSSRRGSGRAISIRESSPGLGRAPSSLRGPPAVFAADSEEAIAARNLQVRRKHDMQPREQRAEE